jgi:hypothetical protein
VGRTHAQPHPREAASGAGRARTAPAVSGVLGVQRAAINGPGELGTIKELLGKWLEEDRRHLLAAADPAGELAKRGLKFRSTYSTGSADAYQKNHEGGDYTLWINGKDVPVHISKAESLNAFLDNWFKKNVPAALAGVAATWKAQYVTVKVSGSHHHQIGVGKAAGEDERDSAGVPLYEPGTGHLEQGLSGLPEDAPRKQLAPA